MNNNIEKQLKVLKEVGPSASLQERIRMQIHTLPNIRPGFNFPLLSFRLALAGIILFIFVGLGSGVVAAAKGSHPGNFLFPLKKAIVQTQINLTSDVDKKAALQKEVEEQPTALPTAKPVIKIKGEEEKENETEKEVEGVSTRAALPRHIISPKEKEDNEDIHDTRPLIKRHADDDKSDSDN